MTQDSQTQAQSSSSPQQTRRDFLQTSAVGLSVPFFAPAVLSAKSPNETVRIGAVGVGGKGWTDATLAAKHAKMVAFCDVDTRGTRRGGYGAAKKEWPSATAYSDWRQMLDKEAKNLDGITVSTPDHMHAPVTMTALKLGLATYTQKPLTRTVFEARALTEAAAEAKVATQMGNQNHSGAGYRTLVNIVQSGMLGKIKEAHSWSNRPIWPQGIDRPKGSDPIPENVNWDLWLGVGQERPYLEAIYHPFKWRGWYDFGAGALGDMGCHIIDPVVWALDLKAPTSVGYEGPKPKLETFPEWEILKYQFSGTQYTTGDTLSMTWWDGGKRPGIEGSHLTDQKEIPTQGAMLIGEKGTIVCPHGKMPSLYPIEKFQEVSLPKLAQLDHYKIWTDAIKTGDEPNSSFAYAGPLTETVLLGVIASRVGGKDLRWNAKTLKFTNSEKANQFIHEEYRKGWEVEGLMG